MPRFRSFVALAACIAAGGIATSAFAIATPADKDVLTNALLPLKGSAGSGNVTIQVDPKARKVCYAVNATGVTGTLSGALTKGSATVVTFKNAPRTNALDGCVDIDQAVAQAVVANPTDYAVSINNGALTATLSPINNFE